MNQAGFRNLGGWRRFAGPAAYLGILSGCAVGPNYHRPPAPDVASYTETKLPSGTMAASGAGGNAQHFALDRQIEGDWWSLFHSPALNVLVANSLRNNPSLAASQDALLAALDQVRAEQGAFFPSLSGSFQAERVHSQLSSGGISTVGSPRNGGSSSAVSTFSLLNASVAVSYAPDIFGGVRRQVESFRAQAQDQRFALEASYLSLTANVVTAAITDASLREQIAATKRIIASEQQGLDILKRQAALGGIAEAAVLTQQAQVETVRATLPPLESQLAQERNQLAAYEGIFPDQFHMPDLNLASLTLPGTLPVSLPSALVRQRPDIREFAALLHEATANVGVATANMLPQITLSAGGGREAFSAAQLFTPQSLIWNLVAGVTQPIFEGGSLLFRRRETIALMREAAANYENTVVLAFQNVSDVLLALQYDAATLNADSIAELSSQRSLAVAQQQFHLGGVPFTTVLTAEQTYDNAVITRIRAQAQRYADTAALFQALGGGWWNRHDVSPAIQSCCGVLP